MDDRKGNRWSKQEDDILLGSIRAGIDIPALAKNHKRTERGIRMRLQRHAFIRVENGEKIENITDLGLTEKELREAVAHYESKKIKKNKPDDNTLLTIVREISELKVGIEMINNKIDKILNGIK